MTTFTAHSRSTARQSASGQAFRSSRRFPVDQGICRLTLCPRPSTPFNSHPLHRLRCRVQLIPGPKRHQLLPWFQTFDQSSQPPVAQLYLPCFRCLLLHANPCTKNARRRYSFQRPFSGLHKAGISLLKPLSEIPVASQPAPLVSLE